MRWSKDQYKDYLSKNLTAQNPTKYGAKRVEFDKIFFASKMELKMYQYLIAKKYSNIILQPKFELQPSFRDNKGNAVRAIHYVADFRIDNTVIEVKGFKTADYKIKEKIFKYKYPELQLLIGTYKELITVI